MSKPTLSGLARFLRLHVTEYEPIPFTDGGSPPTEYEVFLERLTTYRTGTRWEPVPGLFPLARGKTHEEAVTQAKALLNHWIKELE
jgi:predicted RNase H-like HicB family nuclease